MILLKKINKKFSRELAEILSTDKKLNRFLNSKNNLKTVSAEEFERGIKEWETKTNSKTYTMVLDDAAIGTISISYINEKGKEARLGYWLGSSYWRNGYATQAVSLVLGKARRLGVKTLRSKVEKRNIASIKLLRKCGAKEVGRSKLYLDFILGL